MCYVERFSDLYLFYKASESVSSPFFTYISQGTYLYRTKSELLWAEEGGKV